MSLHNNKQAITIKGYGLLFVDLFLLDVVAVRVLSTAVDTVKEQMAKFSFLLLSEQGWMLIVL